MEELTIRLRPVVEDDLPMFRRFATEPGLIGLDWGGFRDAQAPARRFAADGYLGPDGGRLMVEVDGENEAAGYVTWTAGAYATARHWEIGIALLPHWRGRGIGWRAGHALRLPVHPPHRSSGSRPAPTRRTPRNSGR